MCPSSMILESFQDERNNQYHFHKRQTPRLFQDNAASPPQSSRKSVRPKLLPPNSNSSHHLSGPQDHASSHFEEFVAASCHVQVHQPRQPGLQVLPTPRWSLELFAWGFDLVPPPGRPILLRDHHHCGGRLVLLASIQLD